jgi:hypothetical protein
MGSWDELCAWTGLPIRYGTRIVGIPVLAHPRKDTFLSTITYASPYCLPMRGSYIDYGRIEIDPKDEHIFHTFEQTVRASILDFYNPGIRLPVETELGRTLNVVKEGKPHIFEWLYVHERVYDFFVAQNRPHLAELEESMDSYYQSAAEFSQFSHNPQEFLAGLPDLAAPDLTDGMTGELMQALTYAMAQMRQLDGMYYVGASRMGDLFNTMPWAMSEPRYKDHMLDFMAVMYHMVSYGKTFTPTSRGAQHPDPQDILSLFEVCRDTAYQESIRYEEE